MFENESRETQKSLHKEQIIAFFAKLVVKIGLVE